MDIIAYPENEKQLNALKSALKALNISFEVNNEVILENVDENLNIIEKNI